MVTAPVVKAKGLNCPNCGNAVELKGFAYTLRVTCPSCGSMLDTSEPNVKLLGQFQQKMTRMPLIPLGSRGHLKGADWDLIGFQTRAIVVDGTTYEWTEYVLFNPYKGFRYLTEYQGHWNFVTTIESIPEPVIGIRPGVKYKDLTYKHFQHANADTSFVLGEFPWKVQLGEIVGADDYVAPPYMLSAETTSDEITWSLGEYTPGSEIWQGFKLPGSAPSAVGVYANQPSPYEGKVRGLWLLMFFLMVSLAFAAIIMSGMARGGVVFDQKYAFAPGNGEPSFVTPVFELKSTSNVELTIKTSLSNSWAYFNFALINDDTGTAYNFGKEMSYYYGSDSDGSWTEGSAGDSVMVPRIPAGHYYLRVEPEMDKAKATSYVSPATGKPYAPIAMNYELILKNDVPSFALFWIVIILLPIPPIVRAIQAASFNNRRWQESDYATASSSSSSDDDDD
ncbi:MAG: DUF4178 domain-containing protein [Bryobacteraceae bacterium]